MTRVLLVGLVCLILVAPEPLRPPDLPKPGGFSLAAGERTLLWQMETTKGWFNTVYAGDTLIVAEEGRFAGRDAHTGTERWNLDVSAVKGYHGPVDRWMVSGDHVVAVTPNAHDEKMARGDTLLSFSASTGKLKWSLASDRPGTTRYFNWLGGGVIHLPGPGELWKLDAEDGQRRWVRPVPFGCQGVSGQADAWVVGLLVECDGRTWLRAQDARNGDLLWEHEVFPDGQPLVHVTGAVVSVQSPGSITVHDLDGRLLYEHEGQGTCECELAATASGILVTRYDTAAIDVVSEAVDRQTGRLTRMEFLSNLHVLDERIYAAREMQGDLHGREVVIVDPTTGALTPVTTYPRYATLTGISRHGLLMQPRESELPILATYATTPPATVEPTLDICSLLPEKVFAAQFPKGGHRRLARPTACDWIGSPQLAVSLLWAGRTDVETEVALYDILFTTFLQYQPEKALTTPMPGVRLFVTEADVAVVMTNRKIIRLAGAGSLRVTRLLALEIAKRLQGTA
ncbi:PQQ-binding-like beta-propeller repeat protein [Nonomuraea rubra]|uniref:outer membrane protein assembly factor BamB family protein n=1 Tax=Nonomuraea rubra TaxID=46180 RepID=UPI00340EB244